MVYIAGFTEELSAYMWSICAVNSEAFIAFVVQATHRFQMPFITSFAGKTPEAFLAVNFIVSIVFALPSLYPTAIFAAC